MARIVSNFFISMDGVVEAHRTSGTLPCFDGAMGEVVASGMEHQLAFLM